MINPDGTISQVPAGGAPQAPAWGQFGGARPQQPMAPSQPPAAPTMTGSGVQQANPSSAMVQPRTPQPPAGQVQPQSLGNYLRGGMSASGAIGSPPTQAPAAAPSGAAGFGVSQPGSSGNGLNSFMHGNFSPLGPTSNWNPVKRWLGF